MRGSKKALLLTFMGALLSISLMAGCASSDTRKDVEADTAATQQEPVAEPEQHELSFVVEAEGSNLPSSVSVLVTGSQADGVEVNDRHEAALGKTYVLAYPAGSYTFNVDSASLEVGDEIFAAKQVACAFDGSEDHTVRIALEPDTEAMKKAQAEKEEAARQKAAEEKAAAAAEEEAAAAAAEQKAAAAAEREAAAAAAAASNDDAGGDTVYITKTGEKFHRDGCRYLKKSQIAISRSDAVAQGYEACSVCNP